MSEKPEGLGRGKARPVVSMGVLRNGVYLTAEGEVVDSLPVAVPPVRGPHGEFKTMSEGTYVFVPDEDSEC